MAQTSVPVFDAVLPDDLEGGVTAISLVLNPAIQSPFVALADEPQPVRLHLSAEPMKQVVTGPALVPDQPIFRLSGDNKGYYIRFSQATVEALSRRFMASANLAKTTHEHAIDLQGNHVVESWIVTDPTRDKSAALGLTVPAGSWMLSIYMPDIQYWNTEVVSGNRTGFSIEALLDLAEPTLFTAVPKSPAPPTTVSKQATQTRKKNLFQRLMAAVFLSIDKVVDGPEIEVDETTGVVYQIDEQGMRGEVIADGTYTLESGEKLIVVNSQQTSATDAASAAESPAPVEDVLAVAAGEPLPEEPVEAPAESSVSLAKIDELQTEIDKLNALLQQNEEARTALSATITSLNAQLSAEPAAKPVKLAAQPTSDKPKRTFERYAEAALRVADAR